jgi:hypothetical protein
MLGGFFGHSGQVSQVPGKLSTYCDGRCSMYIEDCIDELNAASFPGRSQLLLLIYLERYRPCQRKS